MFAVIELGGKQFSVEKGSRVRCEKLEQQPNATFAVDRVLMIKNGEKVQVGQPYLKGVNMDNQDGYYLEQWEAWRGEK